MNWEIAVVLLPIYAVMWLSFLINYFRNRDLDGYYKTHHRGWYGWNQAETDRCKVIALVGFGLLIPGWVFEVKALLLLGLLGLFLGGLFWLFGNN